MSRTSILTLLWSICSALLFAFIPAAHAAQMGGAIQDTALPFTASNAVVTTLAGGSGGSADGTGTTAGFNSPVGITTDGTNLYVTDYYNRKIRKIVIDTGVVTTLAGSGSIGSTDGTGTAASFYSPNGITTDGANLYVTDSSNNKIRKIVISTGVVTTLAGSGTAGSTDGIGTAASFNWPYGITTDGINVYVADQWNNKIRKIVIGTEVVTTLAGSGSQGAADATGTAASFYYPAGLTTDGTNLYVVDRGNNKIRKVVISTGVVTTLAGSGAGGSTDDTGTAASFNNPAGITTDGVNLYVTDKGNHKIRKIVIGTGGVTTLAGSGTAGSTDDTGTAASFNNPAGITTDGTNLYVADNYNNKIRMIWPDTIAPTVTSTGPANSASVPPNSNITITWDKNVDCTTVNVANITISGGELALASCSNKQAIFTTSGQAYSTYTVTVGTGVKDTVENNMSESYQWSFTTAADTIPPTITATSPTDGATNQFVASPIKVIFSEAMDASTINSTTFTLYAGATQISGTVTYDPGTYTAKFTPSSHLSYSETYIATITTGVKDLAGNAITTSYSWTLTTWDLMGGSKQGYALPFTTSNAIVTTLAGSGSEGSTDAIGTAASFDVPYGITTDGTNLYVAEWGAYKIRKIVISTGVVTTLAGSDTAGSTDGTGTAARFSSPAGITTDGTNLYVADRSNHKIRKIVISTGVVTTLAGSGTVGSADGTGVAAIFASPAGITIDGTNLYVADSQNNKIRKIVISTGVVTTLAGSGTEGSADGTGAAASFYYPNGITTDGTNLYVTDHSTHRIRKIVISTGVVTTLAGSGFAGSTDGTGTAARFYYPYGITTDGTNLYVVDHSNNKIRKIVISTGVVTTLAGSGTQGSADGIGAVASFNFPDGITTDGINIYVADSTNNMIRKIGPDTIAPTISSTSPINGATGVTPNNNITITWDKNVDCTTVNVANITISGGSLALASCSNNQAIFTASGQAYSTYSVTVGTGVKDIVGNNMSASYQWSFTTAADTIATTITSTSPANGITNQFVIVPITATFSEAMDASTINTTTFTLYAGATRITGSVTYDSGTYTAKFTPSSQLSYTTTYTATITTGAKDLAGNAITVNYTWTFTTWDLMGGAKQQGNVLSFTSANAIVTTLAGSGTVGSADGTGAAASFYYPNGITTDGTNLYVADQWNHKIRRIVIGTGVVTILAGSGSAGSADGTGTAASFANPIDITTDGTNLYVADRENNKIRKIVISSGAVTTLAGSGTEGSADGTGTTASFNNPIGITTDGTNLYVADLYNHKIRKIVINTGVVTTLAGSGIGVSADGAGIAASFYTPQGITADGTNLYVLDYQKIRKIVISSGAVTTLAGSGEYGSTDGTGTAARFHSPYGITTDGTNLYVADFGNHKIRKIVISTGVVTTLAGSGVSGSTNAIGTAASFDNPKGITTDGTNLYVADEGNNTIRKIWLDDALPTGTLSINSNASFTNSTAITLNLTCSDANGCSQMQFSNDNSTWSAPEAYATTKSWNLTNGDGDKTVYVRFKDIAGLWSDAFSDTITLDTTPSSVTSASSTTVNGHYKAGSTINITVNFSEATSSSGLTINLNTGASITTGALNNTTSWSGTYTVAAGQTSADLVISSITGTITDAASNSTSNPAIPAGQNISDAKTIVVDTTPPVVSAGSIQTKNTVFTQTATATDANTMTYAWAKQSGTGTITFGTATALSTTIMASVAGTYTIRFTATDAAGNSAYSDMTLVWYIVVNGACGSDASSLIAMPTTSLCSAGTASSVSGSGPWNWTCAGTNGGTTANCTAALADTIAPTGSVTIATGATYTNSLDVALKLSGADIGSGVSQMCVSNSETCTAWEAFATAKNWSLASAPIVGTTGDGTKTVYLKLKDIAGNESAAITSSIILDTTPPELNISTLSDGSTTNSTTLNISGTATDTSGIASLTINDQNITVGSDNTFSYPLSFNAGQNPITIIATDNAGNKTTDTRTITMVVPVVNITITAPADNAKTKQAIVTVRGSVDVASTVTVSVNGGTPAKAQMSGRNFSYAATLIYGINTIEVTAENASGETSSVKRTITYDNQRPSISITEPAEDITTGDSAVTIKGTVTDITEVTVTIAAGDQTYTLTATDGTFEQLVEFAEENTYDVYITATDETGNSSTIQRNIIYALPKILEVVLDPTEGGTVTGSTAIECPDACTETFDAGSHVMLTAQPTEGYIFTGWIGCDITSGKTCTIVMNADISVTASFTASPTLSDNNILVVFKDGDGNGTITSNPSGINCNDTDNADCESLFNKNAGVKLTAKPSSDSIFRGWSGYGKCEGKTTQTCAVTIDDDYTITALFELIPQYTLGVMKAGSGTGTVSAKPAGTDNTISCNSDCMGDSASYAKDKTVILTAKADNGAKFTGWSGHETCEGKTTATCTVRMDADYDITAAFDEIPTYTVTVTPEGNGTGTVTGLPKDKDGKTIACGTSCSADYVVNKPVTVTLKAKPDKGSKLTGWGGDAPLACTAKTTTCKIANLDGNMNVTAMFGKPDVSVSETEVDAGTVTKTDKSGNATFTINNTGDAELKITGVKLTGKDAKMFKVLNDNTNKALSAATIAAGDSLTVKVIFTPVSNNQKTATLKITSDDPTKSTGVSVTLTGTGSGFAR